MKTNSTKLKTLFTGVILAAFCFAGITSAFSQDKPKGKPWNAPESALKMKNPVKSDENAIKEGKNIYAQQCKSCHGPKGKGDGPKAEKIDISCGDFTTEIADKTDGELYWKTTEGRKPMPSFKEKLSDNERWTVIHYIRSFGKEK
jgi:mono/diheme cytochrome c family protein